MTASFERPGRPDAARLGRAREVLTAAFADYPLVQELFPQGRRRAGALSWYADYALRYCSAHGEIFTAGALDAVAACLRADHGFTRRGLIAAGLLLGPVRMGPAAFRRLMRNDAFLAEIRRRNAPQNSWYLWMVGVAPAAQRQGVGGGLIRQVLKAADAEGAGCYLDTHRLDNVRFYRALGFEVVSEGRVPASGLPYWAMARRAGGG
jgi:ribosomal protein S18 acetylase RimI-like enzyme